jgi:cell division inhibitor SepF
MSSPVRPVVRRGSGHKEGETMSALHRLKAYFGMVPAEEFDPSEFDPSELDAAQFHAGFDNYHPDYRAEYLDPGDGGQGYDPACESAVARAAGHAPAANTAKESLRRPHRAAFDDYDDGFATPAGRHAVPRAHPTRSPSWAAESPATEPRLTRSRSTGSRSTDAWATEAPVRGSLAIDTATVDTRSAVRQPVAPQRVTPGPRTGSLAEDALGEGSAHPLARIVTLHPHNYNEARPIGERYREGNPVIMNLTEMEDRDAKRLVDFAAGLAFALRGSIDKVTNKVFLLSPPNVDVSAEDRRRIAEGRFFV